MVKGLYTSALGMITQMQRMDVVTNNIANADTTGYKKDKVAAQSFTEEFLYRLNDPGLRMFSNMPIGKMGNGVFIDEVYTDFSNGFLKHTHGPLHLALNGQGFFSVMVEGEELFTRDGCFTLGTDGTILTLTGGRVQGLNGDIVLPAGEIIIDETGRIFVNNEYIDTFKMNDFTDKKLLRKMQDNLYRRNGAETTEFTGTVNQGFLENSNVNNVSEMVEMIALSRAYETNSKMITIHDTTLGRAVNDIARRS